MADASAAALSFINILSLVIPNGPTVNDLAQRHANELKVLNSINERKLNSEEFPTTPVKILPYLAINHVQGFDEIHQAVLLHCTLVLTWKDNRLGWNPSDFANVKAISRDKSFFVRRRVWFPAVYISDLYAGSNNILQQSNFIDATIYNEGSIQVKVNLQLKTTCLFDYNEYPNDIQNCSITMYTPYDASQMQFHNWGGAHISKYSFYSKPPSVDFKDFRLKKIFSEGYFLFFGNELLKEIGSYKPEYLKSIFRFNFSFQRSNKFFSANISIPVFCALILTCVSGLLNGLYSVTWLSVSIIYQVFVFIEIIKSLPPNYSSLPFIGSVTIFLMCETIVILLYKLLIGTVYKDISTKAEFQNSITLLFLNIFHYIVKITLVLESIAALIYLMI